MGIEQFVGYNLESRPPADDAQIRIEWNAKSLAQKQGGQKHSMHALGNEMKLTSFYNRLKPIKTILWFGLTAAALGGAV